MDFNDASMVLNVLYDAWYADKPRAKNRSLIQDQANGFPPWSKEETDAMNYMTNVNFLDMCTFLQAGRRQFSNAYFNPGRYFTVGLDWGPVHKRDIWGNIITNQINRCLKSSLPYLEELRSKFSNVILHGIGPALRPDNHSICCEPLGVEDVLIPSGTRLVMDNLPWIGIWRQFTAMELQRKTSGPKVDPGWNMKAVNSALKWAKDQYMQQPSYSLSFSPEKVSEQFKESITSYPIDSVPTIDCWMFLYYDGDGDTTGWKKKIVFDNFAGGNGKGFQEKFDGSTTEFLYSSERLLSQKRENFIHFSFGDLSAKAPFLYHSVRSLGYLLYAVCHLQDKLRCRMNDAAFEASMNYFRVLNPEDADRLRKIDLVNKGVIPDGLDFVKPQDRWKVDPQMIEMTLDLNRQSIAEHSASYVQDFDAGKREPKETATKTHMRAQQASAMVGAMLGLSYEYQKAQYTEDCRRFCIPNSPDSMAREFRLACLKRGVPEEALDHNKWDIQVERVLGGGNKAVQISQANNLMAARSLYDPDSQRAILRTFTLAQTDDPTLTEQLVPSNPLKVTNTVHDAELSFSALMQGLPMGILDGEDHTQYIGVLLQRMGMKIQMVNQRGGMATPEELSGFQMVAQNIGQHMQLLAAQGPQVKPILKQFGDVLGKLMNQVKAFSQRLQQAQQAAAQHQGQQGMKPEDQAKLQFQMASSQIKLQTQQAAASQRMRQREAESRSHGLQADIEHGLRIRQGVREHQANLAKTRLSAIAELTKPQPEPANA